MLKLILLHDTTTPGIKNYDDCTPLDAASNNVQPSTLAFLLEYDSHDEKNSTTENVKLQCSTISAG